jgi:crotonobetainyl-CoA:carnitine CoA-transferase CaiB-like acyl-CoA transferase
MVAAWTRPQRRDDIISLLIEKGIPCAPVREVEEVIADPEVAERGMLIESEYPTRGTVRVTGTPVKLSEVPDEQIPKRRPPELGEHTEEVLASIGISREEVAQLRAQRII